MFPEIAHVENQYQRKDELHFAVGDTVDVKVKIREGDKERIQVFNGVVIARKGRGLDAMFTVRRIVQGEGVERTFPLHSPRIAGIDVKGTGRVRRAKLYYLRERSGKATRLEQKIRTDRGRPGAAKTTPAAPRQEVATRPESR